MKTNTFITLSTTLANVGVLIGLILLVIELRQTSKVALSQIRQERVSGILDQTNGHARDSAYSELFYRIYINQDFELLDTSLAVKGQIYQQEVGRFYRLEDSYFQYQSGLMDYAPYRFSMERAANMQPFWDFLGIDITIRNSDMRKDVDVYKTSGDYKRSDWSKNFIAWMQSKSGATAPL